MTWQKVTPNGLAGPAGWWDGILATDDAVANKLWLGAANGLWKSADGGDSWTGVSDFEVVHRLDSFDGCVVVAGRRSGDTWDKIYYAGNDGETWDEVTREGLRFPGVLGLAMDPHREGTIWIGTSGRSVARFIPAE